MSALRQKREEQRKNSYKQGVDEKTLKKERESNQYTIRKQKREELLNKRRNIEENHNTAHNNRKFIAEILAFVSTQYF